MGDQKLSTIGERLKEERLRLGYNQTDFAQLAGVTKNSQINYENDSRHPDTLYLRAINEAGADVNYIITGIRSDGDIKIHLRGMLNMLKSEIEKAIEQTQSEQQ